MVTLKQKIVIWFLIVMAYLFTFMTPIVSAYFFLAKENIDEASKGGFFYYMVVAVFGSALIIGLMRLINKQKSNLFKSMFRWGLKMVVLFAAFAFIEYVDYNIDALIIVLYTAAGGFFVGFLIESYLVLHYKKYLGEVGVF